MGRITTVLPRISSSDETGFNQNKNKPIKISDEELDRLAIVAHEAVRLSYGSSLLV